MDAAAPVEAEQGSVGLQGWDAGTAALDLLAHHRADTRPVGDEAALAELPADHDEHAALDVDIA
jgi:hypothetical protein